MAFKIDPNVAKDTPLKFMMNMLTIHAVVEEEKAREMFWAVRTHYYSEKWKTASMLFQNLGSFQGVFDFSCR